MKWEELFFVIVQGGEIECRGRDRGSLSRLNNHVSLYLYLLSLSSLYLNGL